jgi:hypothetical protein
LLVPTKIHYSQTTKRDGPHAYSSPGAVSQNAAKTLSRLIGAESTEIRH